MIIEKYSIGTGDRFGKQASAQLEAIAMAKDAGTDIAIVWNKSHREHTIIKTEPGSVRVAADKAISDRPWSGAYHVDADHINLSNVDLFLDSSDFFTLDVADYIGEKATDEEIDAFVSKYSSWAGSLSIPGIAEAIEITEDKIRSIAERYLFAVKEAGKIYRHIEAAKGKDTFITEVSMDETELPQTPDELLFILAAISDENIPAQTIAPKFTGRFNKGVDYVGDVAQFAKEFDEDVCVIAYAIEKFGLPASLKLSVHSGSDKFSIYAPIKESIKKHDAGLHLKTAGTNWLEELIGLAESGDAGFAIAKEVYRSSLDRYDELAGPYATVIDIDKDQLPSADEVDAWTGDQFAKALRHDQSEPSYNQHVRQLLHVGYKVAAEMGDRYLQALVDNEAAIRKNVCENLYDRHIKHLFLD